MAARKAKKAAFGGYSISFKGCSDTLENVMGSSPIGPSEMTKRIWGYVKRKKIGLVSQKCHGCGSPAHPW
jgi:hypothetical protein